MNQQILLDVGGDVTFDATQGRATGTPTVTLVKPDDTTISTPAVTNDSVDTTVNASAAAGAAALTLTSTTGVAVGRRYLIDNTLNDPEWVHIKSVDSATAVTLHGPIAYAYSTGDAFQGTRLTAAVSAAEADTLDEGYEARWSYVVDSITHRPISQWDVVRAKWPQPGELVPTWKFKRYAMSMADDELEGDDGAGLDFSEDLLVADDLLRIAVEARGYRISRFRSFDEFEVPLMERLLFHWADQGVNVPAIHQDDIDTWRDIRRQAFSEALTDALNTTRSYDADETGTLSTTEKDRRLGAMRLYR